MFCQPRLLKSLMLTVEVPENILWSILFFLHVNILPLFKNTLYVFSNDLKNSQNMLNQGIIFHSIAVQK